jgi:hypothetical protein
MRVFTAGSAIVVAALACSTAPKPTTADSRLDCPGRLLATVTNRMTVGLDVYYQERARPAAIVGEIAPSSTQTFPLRNDATGFVTLRGPGGGYVVERPGSPNPQIDIRMHCAP